MGKEAESYMLEMMGEEGGVTDNREGRLLQQRSLKGFFLYSADKVGKRVPDILLFLLILSVQTESTENNSQ